MDIKKLMREPGFPTDLTTANQQIEIYRVELEAANARIATAENRAKWLQNEIDNLRFALAWIEDQDPQIIERAREKFDLAEG